MLKEKPVVSWLSQSLGQRFTAATYNSINEEVWKLAKGTALSEKIFLSKFGWAEILIL